ncbi:MAG: hypothetical protein IPJ88_01645 [Myxococcales bacterium]|nr:MAG: hypothetical protein IPJ88_01645 [Myxococcales bacterium]
MALTELGTGSYSYQSQSLQGGLYDNGINFPPQSTVDRGLQLATELAEQDRVVLVSLGMSNTGQEYTSFMSAASSSSEVHDRVLLVNGAQGGQTAQNWDTSNAATWDELDQRVAQATGLSNVLAQQEVNVIWIKLSINKISSYDDPLAKFRQSLEDVIRVASSRYPNLKQVFLSSRTHAFTSDVENISLLNPEPFAYTSAFAVKDLIQASINGQFSSEGFPLLVWGPYIWAEGSRNDNTLMNGFTWTINDVEGDCTHPGPTGEEKVGQALLKFFLNDPLAAPWFRADGAAGTPYPENASEPPTIDPDNDAGTNDGSSPQQSGTAANTDSGGCALSNSPTNSASPSLALGIVLLLWFYRRKSRTIAWCTHAPENDQEDIQC